MRYHPTRDKPHRRNRHVLRERARKERLEARKRHPSMTDKPKEKVK